jgi:hypothetical protein
MQPTSNRDQRVRDERNAIAISVLPAVVKGEYAVQLTGGESITDEEAFEQLCVDRAFGIAKKFQATASK